MGIIADKLSTAMRDFQRYTGDGLPGEPVGRPLPVGDPASGQHNPPKKQVRDAFLVIAETADDLTEAAAGTAADRVQTGLDRAAVQVNAALSLTYKNQAQVAAIAAGAPLVTTLTDPVPANDTVEILQTSAGGQVWEVVGAAWAIVGWLTQPEFPDIAALALVSGLIDGQSASVRDGSNGQREDYDWLQNGSLTADGALVVDGVGGQWVSRRTVYADVDEFKTDPRPDNFFSADSLANVKDRYFKKVGAGNLIETNGGAKWLPLPDKDGAYSPGSFFELGETDDTARLKKALSYCIAERAVLLLSGSYTVSGPISDALDIADGAVQIKCVGSVDITVDPASPGFSHLIYCASNVARDMGVTGGGLTIDCNHKCAAPVLFRHYGATRAGSVYIEQLKVLNVKETDAASTVENGGIAVIGDWDRITINQPHVDGVDRANASGGASGGITVSGFSGLCEIYRPFVARVAGDNAVDWDGIKVFGKLISGARHGAAVIYDPVLEDNKGRQVKSQCASTVIYRPTSKRHKVQGIVNSVDFDFQTTGDAQLIDPVYYYKTDGGLTPLGSKHIPVVFAHQEVGAASEGLASGGTMRTDVAMEMYCFSDFPDAAGPHAITTVDRLTVIATGALATSGTTAFERGIGEFEANEVMARAAESEVHVRNVKGPISCAMISYVGYTSDGSPEEKLSWSAVGNHNTISVAPRTPIHALSGNVIKSFKSFLVEDNSGFINSFFGATLDMSVSDFTPGCVFVADISPGANVIANLPSGLGTSGYALVECLGGYLGATGKSVRLTEYATGKIFSTLDGGASWTNLS